MVKQWELKAEPSADDINKLHTELCTFSTALDEFTNTSYRNFSKLLLQRGISSVKDAKSFNNFDLDTTHSPWLMHQMDIAVTRILKAIENKETIVIYGDYDVDGTTSVALMVKFLRQITDKIKYYIPDRYSEGYGVSLQGVDWAKKENASIIVSLDCGIKANQQIAYANSLNIDFIVCDHHTPGETLPEALAILDPKKNECTYPYYELSGCAIGYKLCQAISEKKPIPNNNIHSLLQFVAISLACDIVPLTGENRVLCANGLQLINNRPIPSILLLLKNTENSKQLTVTDLVFGIGPKINAAGRIASGKEAVDLLLETSPEKIKAFSAQIEQHNTERKEKDKIITQEAIAQIESNATAKETFGQVLFKSNWHKGVIGIVASRVIEKHYKPTVVLTQSSENTLTGSVRSVAGFDVYNALNQCSEHIIQFGGHKYAAGLTLYKSELPNFTHAFNEAVKKQANYQMFTPKQIVDLELELCDIHTHFKSLIDKLEPYGPSNMAPVFITKNLIDAGNSKAVGADKTHLKLHLACPKSGAIMSGIAFGFGHLAKEINDGALFDLVYSIDENHWKGNVSLQLMIKDIRIKGN